MKTRNPIMLAMVMILIATLACSIPSSGVQSSTPTPTAAVGSVIGIIGGIGGGSGGSGSAGGGSGGGSGGSGGTGGSNAGASTPAPTPNPTPAARGPYVVSQIESLGGETVSGTVCDVTQQFVVTSTSPKITFDITFSPQDAERGSLAYAYSFPALGETHDATGSYTLSQAGADGTLLLTMTVSDHVVFKGFDGLIPINYKFNLVPSNSTPCPTTP
jgi:hypothetical protein